MPGNKKILKTLIIIKDEGIISRVDTIEYKNILWLVPEWIDQPSTGISRPKRIISLRLTQVSDPNSKGLDGVDFILSEPIPRLVLEGHGDAGKYTVIEDPDILFPSAMGAN